MDDRKDARPSANDHNALAAQRRSAKPMKICIFLCSARARARQRGKFKSFEICGSGSGGRGRALLGKLRCTAAALRALRGIVCPLPCPFRAALLLALAQCGHLRVNLLDLRVHDLAY